MKIKVEWNETIVKNLGGLIYKEIMDTAEAENLKPTSITCYVSYRDAEDDAIEHLNELVIKSEPYKKAPKSKLINEYDVVDSKTKETKSKIYVYSKPYNKFY